MTKVFLPSVAGVTLLAGYGFQFQSIPSIDAVKSYSSDGIKITGVGACSVTEASVDCWNMDGVRNKDLSAQVMSYFYSMSRGASFYLGRKNRYLIFNTAVSPYYASYGIPGDNFIQTMTMGFQPNDVQLLLYGAAPGDTEASVAVTINGLPGPKPADISFKEGDQASYMGKTFTVGGFRSLPKTVARPDTYSQFGTGKSWLFFMGGDTNLSEGSLSFAALDAKGEPIAYVDKNGTAVSSIDYLKSVPTNQNPGYSGINGGPSEKYRQAVVLPTGPGAKNAFSLTSNIDPNQVKSIRITARLAKRIVLKGFPLDPKS